MKTKSLNKSSMLKNINGLSEGDRAYCGPYGTITCTSKSNGKRNSRKFSVSASRKLTNRGNYTMKALREAIQFF